MNRQEVIAKINEFLVDEFEVEEDVLQPDAVLQEVLDLDSLDYVDLVVVIESNFGFKLTAEDFKEISTLVSFYDLICKKLNLQEEEV